jgi:hypothetical protein
VYAERASDRAVDGDGDSDGQGNRVAMFFRARAGLGLRLRLRLPSWLAMSCCACRNGKTATAEVRSWIMHHGS